MSISTVKSLKVKKDFPFFTYHKDLVYLDSAATTHKPKQVIDTLKHFYESTYATVHRAVYKTCAKASEEYAKARLKVANFIHADFEEIIYTSGTTQSLNMVSYLLEPTLKEGDEIVISEIEHHANFLPWQRLAKQKNLVLKQCPILEDGSFNIQAFKKLLTANTKIVSVPMMSNVTGTIFPIKEITKLAHNIGAIVIVDAAQAVSHLPIDVKDLDVDFLAFSSHKMYGPTSIGVLYGKYEHLKRLHPVFTGGDMVVSIKEPIFQKPPLKFEAGTPKIAEAIGLASAIDYINSYGIESIHAYEMCLLDELMSYLKEIPNIHIYTARENRGPIVSFVIQGIHCMDIATLLDGENIAIRSGHLCAQSAMKKFNISQLLRVSFGMYNTSEDIEKFIRALKSSIKIIKIN